MPLSARITPFTQVGGPGPRRRPRPFTPFAPPDRPPPGTYDPGLDAAERGAQRGYLDTLQDTEAAGQRADSGYAIDQQGVESSRDRGRFDIGQRRDRGIADSDRQRSRSLSDLLLSRSRAGEDFASTIEGIGRGYKRQGQGQAQQSEAQGVAQGGTLKAALAARKENEGIDRAPVERGFQRFSADSQRTEGRVNEDTDLYQSRLRDDSGLADSRLTEDSDSQLGRLALALQYGEDDRQVGLGRAGRELGEFEADTGATRFYQAAQSGQYAIPRRGEPGGPPSNEFSDARGAYRVVVRGKARFRVRPDGTEERIK